MDPNRVELKSDNSRFYFVACEAFKEIRASLVTARRFNTRRCRVYYSVYALEHEGTAYLEYLLHKTGKHIGKTEISIVLRSFEQPLDGLVDYLNLYKERLKVTNSSP